MLIPGVTSHCIIIKLVSAKSDIDLDEFLAFKVISICNERGFDEKRRPQFSLLNQGHGGSCQ